MREFYTCGMSSRIAASVFLCISLLCISKAVSSADGLPDSPVVAFSETGQFLTKSFLSEPFRLGPGEVHEEYHWLLDMPDGHVALRSLTAEIVDESGASIPLNEVYLHHWLAGQIYVKDSHSVSHEASAEAKEWDTGNVAEQTLLPNLEEAIPERHVPTHGGFQAGAPNCGAYPLGAWFGVGAETRRTVYEFPAPYGVEIGNPDKVPAGKKAMWISQIHAIDTRGAADSKACIECRCDAYNTTKDEKGRPLPEGYIGGLLCCYQGRKCQVVQDYRAEARTLYAMFTVKWVPMDPCVVPVRIYDLDVTECQVEYNVDSCPPGGSLASCVDTRHRPISFPDGGRLVYAAGHQHVGGLGISLKGEDGRMLCDSLPIYGRGDTAGDEAGYVTGMEECMNGGLVIKPNETVSVTSTYSRIGGAHTGVMGLYYMAVAVEEDYSTPPRGLCLGPEGTRLAAQEARLGATGQWDEAWRVSLWRAAGGFLTGLLVTGGMAALVLLLVRRQQQQHPRLDGAAYSVVASA